MKYLAELGRSRVGKPLPARNLRKTDDSGIPGPARGREGLIRDLQDVLIPYTPEELIALLRLALTRDKLTRDMPIAWEFSGDLANDD